MNTTLLIRLMKMSDIAQWFENLEYQLRLVQETQGRQQRELDELKKGVNDLRRLSKLLGEIAGAMEPAFPRRDDPFEGYIKYWRDRYAMGSDEYDLFDSMLDRYRELADTGRSLEAFLADD